MHPVLILVPVAALMFGPRLWVGHVLKKHNRRDVDVPVTAGELARELLDGRGLQMVKVEITDLGDHYDPRAKSVRLGRDKHARKTLTALTTAAHEVAHAIQDASGYAPFVWRTRLVKLAQVTGEVGSVLLLAVPAAAILGRGPVPPVLVGTAAMAMLGTGVLAQLMALPSELDASFNRALPMLRAGFIDGAQLRDARHILLACSLTYVAASLVSILHVWPWVGRPIYLTKGDRREVSGLTASQPAPGGAKPRLQTADAGPQDGLRSRPCPRACTRRGEAWLRRFGKPLIRGWLSLTDGRTGPPQMG